jgi:hypothetical protein
MQAFNDKIAPYQLPFEMFGTELRVCTNTPELLERIELMLPLGWRSRPRSPKQVRLGLLAEDNDIYSVYRPDGMCIHDAPGREYALTMLDSQIQGHIALEAPDFTFIHAGVVADGHRALVMPGLSFSGKTTLVRAMVAAGAVYYSDETGRVHPYSKRLSIRRDGGGVDDYRVEELGGVAGLEPLPMGLMIATRYRPGAQWQPSELSAGAAALAMLEHAVPAQTRPEQTMRVLKKAAEGAVALQGERGEADALAEVLLESLRAMA